MSSVTARHRAPRRPITPATVITGITQAAGSNTSRRAAVVATAGGLLVSTFGTGAADVEQNVDAATRLSAAGIDTLLAGAIEALEATPKLVIDADTNIQVESAALGEDTAVNVTPKPAPPPPPVARVAPAAARGAAVPASAAGSAVVAVAARYVGTPYVFGGTTPAGFDCSGFTSYVFRQVGIELPRTSASQRHAGTVIAREYAQPGDLIWTPGHVAIYVGDGQRIHSPRPGRSVEFSAVPSNATFIRVG